MAQFSKLRHLSGTDHRLLVRTFWVVAGVRLRLSLLPFSANRSLIQNPPPVRTHRSLAAAPDRIAWAVRAVSRMIPQATCLTQALSGQKLLAQAGYASKVVVGVAKSEQGALNAHAWLEYNEQYLLGGSQDNSFILMPSLEAQPLERQRS